jgi:hypothetical protein
MDSRFGIGRGVAPAMRSPFAGYDRNATRHPVEYPTAPNPQAWSTGAPFLLLRHSSTAISSNWS